jgi:hypothetical protein
MKVLFVPVIGIPSSHFVEQSFTLKKLLLPSLFTPYKKDLG